MIRSLLNKLSLVSTVVVLSFTQTTAQTYTDGPMKLEVRVGYVWVCCYHDVLGGNQEPVWYVYTRDDSNQDGLGWRNSAGCIDKDCACSLWQGQPGGFNEVLMNHNYGTNVPQRLDFEMECWEDDAGNDCSTFNSGCGSICVDPDDAHCGRASLANNIYYRNAGPPCSWVGADDSTGPYDYYLCSGGNQWGAGIQFRWTYNENVNNTHIWKGHVSTDWFEPCNWGTNSVPTSTKNVIIPASGYTYAPTISNFTAYCNTCEIQGSTVVTIETATGAYLQVTQ